MGLEVKDFLEQTNHLAGEIEVRMGTKDYHQSGEVFFTGYNFEFDIDWNDVQVYTLKKFRELVELHMDDVKNGAEIQSTDVDDFNTINFIGVLEIDGVVVLVED